MVVDHARPASGSSRRSAPRSESRAAGFRLIARDSSVWAGRSRARASGFPRLTAEPPQQTVERLVRLAQRQEGRAFATVDSTFRRFRDRRVRQEALGRRAVATRSGSNAANACRYPSRLRRIVAHEGRPVLAQRVSISYRWR